jgi:hypothetical protein
MSKPVWLCVLRPVMGVALLIGKLSLVFVFCTLCLLAGICCVGPFLTVCVVLASCSCLCSALACVALSWEISSLAVGAGMSASAPALGSPLPLQQAW